MGLEAIAPFIGGGAGALGLGFGIYQHRQRHKQQLLTDLQGGKEAVAAAADQIRQRKHPHRLDRLTRRRQKVVLRALCLAAVFEGSGRSRALIYAALARSMEQGVHSAYIGEVVDEISTVARRNSPYTDLSRASRRIHALRAAIGLGEDIRLKVDCREIPGKPGGAPDQRLKHEAHSWLHLVPALQKQSSLVLISTASSKRSEGYSVLALDFHRVAKARVEGGERLQLTTLGEKAVRAKYKVPPGLLPDNEMLEQLARPLGELVRVHPRYAAARWIAAVPGTDHPFSRLLGQTVAGHAGKPFVELVLTSDPDKDPFRVVEPSAIVNLPGILVDDVYRTGKTWKRAAAVLETGRAAEVLGLAATCTVSADTTACADDEVLEI